MRSSSGARHAARTGSRCRPRPARPWPPTWPGAGRPQGARHLFLTCRAPRGPIRADLVGDVVQRACLRAGLPRVGPHRLRHALAAELLRQGAGLAAISQVLRHQDLATTALYAKVDLAVLRQSRALAGNSPVSALEQALADYLQLRHSLGHELAEAGWLLPGFVAYLDERGLPTVTVEAALAWARRRRRARSRPSDRGG